MMRTNRLFIVSLLGFSSGLPFALLGGTLQAWFADAGLSVTQTGLLSLLGLPYVYRVFFAPLTDCQLPFALGRRRTWMIGLQTLLLIGFYLLTCYHPRTTPHAMLWIAIGLSFCSAFQDVVIDAQRIEYLSTQDYGLGASLAVLGYRLALLVGGGGALIFAQYHGWVWTYRLLGCAMLIGLLAAWFSKEPTLPKTTHPQRLCWQDWVLPFKEWFARPYAWLGLGFIFSFKLGDMLTGSSSGIIIPFLYQGLGFSLATIGMINKIGGICMLLIGGLFAGWLLRSVSLFRILLYSGILQAFSVLFFLALAMLGKQTWLLIIAVLVDNWVAGMSATALTALLMRWVDQTFTATQFSLLVAFTALPRLFSGPFAAYLQSLLGWTGVYTCGFILAWLFLPILWRLRRIPMAWQ